MAIEKKANIEEGIWNILLKLSARDQGFIKSLSCVVLKSWEICVDKKDKWHWKYYLNLLVQ